jgi:hypothetical protein
MKKKFNLDIGTFKGMAKYDHRGHGKPFKDSIRRSYQLHKRQNNRMMMAHYEENYGYLLVDVVINK